MENDGEQLHDMYRDEPTVCEVRGKRTAQQVPLTVGSNNASAMSGCIQGNKDDHSGVGFRPPP